jgi:acyl-coenzyme A thioesterase PaaI-like protein
MNGQIALRLPDDLRANGELPVPSSHASCMICGESDSLALRFSASGSGVVALIQADAGWQGYAGVMHGGMISTLLDATMTHCLFRHGVEAMTADLQVRFLKPVPCTGLLELHGRLIGQRRQIYEVCAELSCAGELHASATARFMRRKRSPDAQ